MHTEDTEGILQECDAGVKTALDSIDAVIDRTNNEELRTALKKSRTEHVQLANEITTLLDEPHQDRRRAAHGAHGRHGGGADDRRLQYGHQKAERIYQPLSHRHRPRRKDLSTADQNRAGADGRDARVFMTRRPLR